MHLVAANVGTSMPIASGARIELYFDRLLLPISVTRQSVVLVDLNGNGLTPEVAYDPVARVVTLTPISPLDPCQSYQIQLPIPTSLSDANGLRAIDGAVLASSTPKVIEFPVAGTCTTDAGPPPGQPGPPAPVIDFCQQINPIFQSKCAGPTCHGGKLPAEGLRLDSPQAIADTMIGQVAHESNTGPRAQPQPPSQLFGLDMPIVDPGAPGDSWLTYKLLLAYPPPCSSTADAPPCDASVPGVMHNLHALPWTGLSASERSTLASYIPGRAMPFPNDPSADPSAGCMPNQVNCEPLTYDELEAVSFWIQEGAPVPACP